MSVETTLPHGLKTSVLGSAYKVEQDQNLSLLDNDRITVGPIGSRPAFGVARRFWFDPATKQLSYDDGTQWIEDLTRQSNLIIESLSLLNQDLTTDADVTFNSAIISSNLSVGTTTPSGKLHIKQTSATQVQTLEQLESATGFIDFVGTENATTGSIKTGLTAHGGTIKFIKCEINGTEYYLQASTTPA